MTTFSITVPARLAGSLALPDLSLADGSPAVELVSVLSIGGGLFRRAIRVGLPLDRESVAVARRTERLSRIRQYVVRPAKAEWVLDEVIGSAALPQHPRRSKAGVRISYLPESLAREIVRRNPGTALSR
jgi:hypothetical protein